MHPPMLELQFLPNVRGIMRKEMLGVNATHEIMQSYPLAAN